MVAVATIALSGCSAQNSTPIENTVESLLDRPWALWGASLGGDFDLPFASTEAAGPTLTFNTDGTLSGSTGCRDFTGEWKRVDHFQALNLGVRTSDITASGPGCPSSTAEQVSAARLDARILAALREPATIGIGSQNALLISGGPRSGADDGGPVMLVYQATPDEDFTWGEVNNETGTRTLDDATRRTGPITGDWTFMEGGIAGGFISPGELEAEGFSLRGRDQWTFEGSSFETGEGCSSISGTIDGELAEDTTFIVTSIGDCALDRDDSSADRYDLTADQLIQALSATTTAGADATQLVLDNPSGLLAFAPTAN